MKTPTILPRAGVGAVAPGGYLGKSKAEIGGVPYEIHVNPKTGRIIEVEEDDRGKGVKPKPPPAPPASQTNMPRSMK